MSNDKYGRDSTEKLVDELRKVMDAPEELTEGDKEQGRVDRLGMLVNFVFGNAASAIKRMRALRARLPFPPWLVKTATSIGVVGVLGAGVWLVRMDVRARAASDTADEAKATASEAATAVRANYDKLDDRLRPTEQGVVKLNADMENLLQERGVQPATRAHRRRVARELGLPVDSTVTDSSGL